MLKTHLHFRDITGFLDNIDVKVLLLTTATDEESKADQLTNFDGRVAYVQLLDVVKYSPVLVMPDYARVFNLTSEDQLGLATASIEYWDTRPVSPCLEITLISLLPFTC